MNQLLWVNTQTKKKNEISLADERGQIKLVLWRQRAKEIKFKENDVISIQNAVTSIFNSKVNITSTWKTIIKVVQELITVTTNNSSGM
jgi:ssDNA-binding replication factor A large subunit